MKKTVGVLFTMLMIVFLQPLVAQAEDQKVIAIIDTAIDSNKNSSVIHEVCITTFTVRDANRYCPNGTQFQEGKGAANVRDWTIKGAGYNIDHGHNIAQVVNQVSPDVKIVFVRISEITSSKTVYTHGQSLSNAVKWVADNASRFGIDAVSISMSRSNFTAGTCPVDNVLSGGVQRLKNQGITTYAATGNDSKTNMVGFPACVTDVVGVGAVTSSGALYKTTNSGPGMDATFLGEAKVVNYNGFSVTIHGTSVASPGLATFFLKQQ
jgi:hypothetical protein